MMKYMKVEGQPGFVRDAETEVILNVNAEEVRLAKARKAAAKAQKAKLEQLEQDVQDIKGMLGILIEKINGDNKL